MGRGTSGWEGECHGASCSPGLDGAVPPIMKALVSDGRVERGGGYRVYQWWIIWWAVSSNVSFWSI